MKLCELCAERDSRIPGARQAIYAASKCRTDRLARNRLYFASEPKPHQCASFADYLDHAGGVRQQVLSGADAKASATESNFVDDNYINEEPSLN